MKKLICAIMFLLSLPAASVHAQAFKEMTFFELSAGSGVKHHGITPVDFSFKLHVDLLPFAYIFIAAEDNIALYKNDGAKSYSNGCSMGGGLGFKLLNGVKGKHALDVRVKSLSTLAVPTGSATLTTLRWLGTSKLKSSRRSWSLATDTSTRAPRTSTITATPISLSD